MAIQAVKISALLVLQAVMCENNQSEGDEKVAALQASNTWRTLCHKWRGFILGLLKQTVHCNVIFLVHMWKM